MKLFALIWLQITGIGQLLQDLESFQKTDGIRQGIVAASIKRVADQKEILTFNAGKSVNSASTFKLITTGTAISILGPGYTFNTQMGHTGTIKGKTLYGNLVLVPSGDPSLGSDRGAFSYHAVKEGILNAIRKLGLEKIEGNLLILDPSIFDPYVPDSWIWGDIGNYYGAVPHAFNIHENYYKVYFDAGHTTGDEAIISHIFPFDTNWEILNQVKTAAAGTGDQVYIYASPGSETLVMKGTIPLGAADFEIKGAIPNPAVVFRKQLLTELAAAKINISQANIEPQPSDLAIDKPEIKVLHTFHSAPLSQLAKDCNYFSINIYADALLNTLGGWTSGSAEKGLTTLKKYWQSQGLNLSGFSPKDGSGLSPSGLVTAESMTDILCKMKNSASFSSFYSSIPVYGKDGSLRFKDPENLTAQRVRAKSGYISQTRAYAGYFHDKNGELYAFMVCVNRYDEHANNTVRHFLDNLLIKFSNL